MEQEQIIRQLVMETIDSDRTVEDVCREHPELAAEVRRRSRQVRVVQDQVEAMFPTNASAPQDASVEPAPHIPGYDNLRVLGRGGMGVVYRATHVLLNRTVAIKVPIAGAFATASERQRHMREARAVAALGHPNIITVHDVGEVEGRPYFTMEYIDGRTLAERLAGTPQPARDAATMVATLADAAHCAHQAGIVHRDLKPANILLSPAGVPKIADFGLARQSGKDVTLTVGGFQFGTPSYMSPEQTGSDSGTQGKGVDIYALGAILYEMLTGRPPFRAENAAETMRQVREEDPAPPSRLNPKVPRDIETICLNCLRKEPHRRYPDAQALAEDLRRFLRGEPIHARPVGATERLYRWGRRHPGSVAIIGIAACAVAAGLGVGFWVQHVQSVRAGETALREGRARQAIETAVGLVGGLRQSGRWIEARHVLDDAYSRLPEANSTQCRESLGLADRLLTTANQLDDIRRRYPETNDRSYDYGPAGDAYSDVFTGFGLGPMTPVEAAAEIVASSPIRSELLAALDNAAFVARVNKQRTRLERWLATARAADPDPWRDRFRQPAAWYDRRELLALCEDSAAAKTPPAPHQIVIIGVLLSGLGANDKSIEILRAAHDRDPSDFWVNVELGNSLGRAGRHADASNYFRAAVTLQPKNAAPWISLGHHLKSAGSREEAAIAAGHAIDINPRIVQAWINQATYLRELDRPNEAEAVLTQAIIANPDRRDVLDPLAVSVRWQRARRAASYGDWSGAFDIYRSSFAENEDAEFWFEVAAVGRLIGDIEAAELARGVLMSRRPQVVPRSFLVARTVTLAPTSADTVRAVAALSEPELRENASVFWSLSERGALLCRLGCYAEAVGFFERSLAAAPAPGRAGPVWLWLAIAHHHLGHQREAARWHKAAVEWLGSIEGGMPENALAQGFHLHNWLEAHVLLREADALLASPPSPPLD